MRIEYRILWIDDNPEWVESKIDNIEEYLLNFGFVLKYEIKPSHKGIDFSQYDIIAVDCNLSNGEKGIEALDVVRKNDIYTEILFYSQNGEPKLREEMKNNRIDGVYCASREDSIEKLEKLISTTIQKTQEINNLRGLVMAETSELDQLVKSILLKMKWAEEHFLGHHKKLGERYDERKSKLGEHLPFNPENLASLICSGHFDSMFSFFSLQEFVAKSDWNEIKDYKEIIEKRNILAHCMEQSSSAEKIIILKTKKDGSTEPIIFTPYDFIELRKKIKYFRDKFENLNK